MPVSISSIPRPSGAPVWARASTCRLTLDEKKLAQHRAIAEKQAKEAAEERLQSEREHADSLAQAEFERAAAGTAEEQPADEPAAAGNDEGFFD